MCCIYSAIDVQCAVRFSWTSITSYWQCYTVVYIIIRARRAIENSRQRCVCRATRRLVCHQNCWEQCQRPGVRTAGSWSPSWRCLQTLVQTASRCSQLYTNIYSSFTKSPRLMRAVFVAQAAGTKPTVSKATANITRLSTADRNVLDY